MPGQFGMMPQSIADRFSQDKMTPRGGMGLSMRTAGNPFGPRRANPGSSMDPRLLDILHALLQSQPPGGGMVGGGGSLPQRMGADMLGGIPRFAEGGIVDQPTLGVIGDAGPEAVVPLTGSPSSKGFLPSMQYFAKRALGGGGDQGASGTIQGLLSGGKATFGPDYLRNALRRNAIQTGSSMQRRGDILARLAGLDPMQQRQAMIEGDRAASSGVAGALNAADLQGLSGYQDFIRQLLTGERGYQFQADQARAQREWERQQQQGGLGGMFGSLVGAGLGAFTGGLGTGAAEAVFH